MTSRKELLLRFAASEPASPEDSDVSDLQTILDLSEKFNEKNTYPIESNRTKNLRERGDELLLKNVNETYPLVHESVLELILDFLDLKTTQGSDVERKEYENITVEGFVDRMLIKRPLLFVGERDRYMLRDDPNRTEGMTVHQKDSQGKIYKRKTAPSSGSGGFEAIGTKSETAPLLMKDYMTYDEMKISALLATCSPTCTLNKGERHNRGRLQADDQFIRHAYIVGVVGTRMVKQNVMEAQDIRITQTQNGKGGGPFYGKPDPKTQKNSLGQIFARLYNIPYFPLYQDVKRLLEPSVMQRVTSAVTPGPELNKEHFISVQALDKRRGTKKLKTEEFFNKFVYQERIRLTAETFLAEANHRAKVSGKKAYVHVVGLGLGVWKMLNVQQAWYVDVFGEVLKKFRFEHISDIDFSWIPVKTCLDTASGQVLEGTNTTVHISMRDPYEPLSCLDAEDKIVVSSWAYDGNSYPGNEYWAGSLHTSGDPQAACATQVPELHNPLVNPKMRGRNLHVAMRETGEVVSFKDYWKRKV